MEQQQQGQSRSQSLQQHKAQMIAALSTLLADESPESVATAARAFKESAAACAGDLGVSDAHKAVLLELAGIPGGPSCQGVADRTPADKTSSNLSAAILELCSSNSLRVPVHAASRFAVNAPLSSYVDVTVAV